MIGAKRLGLAGFLATAVAFGPARNGYGLFLPYFREEFALSTAMLGLIASGLYAGYLLALSAVGLLASGVGPRPLVLAGLVSAALGMALVATAPNAWVLAAGIVLAGTSAGWSWAPYNDAAERGVPKRYRDRVLSVVSTGTTFGILAAGLTALAAGASWRGAWFVFALGAVAAAAPNALILPGASHDDGEGDEEEGSLRRPGWRWLLRAKATPLFVVALVFGVTSAFYFSFAVDLVARSRRAVSDNGGVRLLLRDGRGRLRRPPYGRCGGPLRAGTGAPRHPCLPGRRGLPAGRRPVLFAVRGLLGRPLRGGGDAHERAPVHLELDGLPRESLGRLLGRPLRLRGGPDGGRDIIILGDLHMSSGRGESIGTFDRNEGFFYDGAFERFVDHLLSRAREEGVSPFSVPLPYGPAG
ncbi:MAG: MFS transporter [Actinomycetota bacterium]|nr:MFS transporter [Actinomycetota bacterium]